MQLNREQFLQEGYLVLREVVPPERLASLRAESEQLVERRKVRWAAERGPDDPPGGVWETSAQPRLQLGATPELVDEQTAGVVEFWLHDNTLGVSRELLQMPNAGVTEMMMMCNPVSDRGPAALRCVLAGDPTGYCAGLDALQPGIGDKGKWLLTVYLSKAAAYVHILQNPQVEAVVPALRASAQHSHPTTLHWGPSFAERFTPTEAAALWQRFVGLDIALQSKEHHVAGFQGGPVPYHFNAMPLSLDLESFMHSWSDQA